MKNRKSPESKMTHFFETRYFLSEIEKNDKN